MSLPLLHSPSEILAALMTSMGLTVAPTSPPSQTSWQVYVDNEPTVPDNCVTVKDTTQQQDCRTQPDGESMVHEGIQIRVRAVDHPTGNAKARAIKKALEEQVLNNSLTLNNSAGTATYLVPCLVKTQLLGIGKDVPGSKRSLFTVNLLMPVRRVA